MFEGRLEVGHAIVDTMGTSEARVQQGLEGTAVRKKAKFQFDSIVLRAGWQRPHALILGTAHVKWACRSCHDRLLAWRPGDLFVSAACGQHVREFALGNCKLCELAPAVARMALELPWPEAAGGLCLPTRSFES